MAAERAVELMGDRARPGPFLFTCEHASNALPPGWTASASDRGLLDDHWGWDVGARDVVERLVDRLGGRAVLGAFSRLVVDLNRDPASPTFIVRAIAGVPVELNSRVDPDEVARRTASLFDPYHAAIDGILGEAKASGEQVHLVAVHSFTPVYLGQRREVEVGILFDDHDAEAEALHRAVSAQAFQAALNQPYSGKGPDGLIYAARRHGRAHAVKYLELEIRQDLIDSSSRAAEIAGRLADALEVFRPPRAGGRAAP